MCASERSSLDGSPSGEIITSAHPTCIERLLFSLLHLPPPLHQSAQPPLHFTRSKVGRIAETWQNWNLRRQIGSEIGRLSQTALDSRCFWMYKKVMDAAFKCLDPLQLTSAEVGNGKKRFTDRAGGSREEDKCHSAPTTVQSLSSSPTLVSSPSHEILDGWVGWGCYGMRGFRRSASWRLQAYHVANSLIVTLISAVLLAPPTSPHLLTFFTIISLLTRRYVRFSSPPAAATALASNLGRLYHCERIWRSISAVVVLALSVRVCGDPAIYKSAIIRLGDGCCF